jgi:hypothetical protein
VGVGEFIFGILESLVGKWTGRWRGERGRYCRLGCRFGSGCSERIGHRDGCRETDAECTVQARLKSSLSKTGLPVSTFLLKLRRRCCRNHRCPFSIRKMVVAKIWKQTTKSFEIKIADQISVKNRTTGDGFGDVLLLVGLRT